MGRLAEAIEDYDKAIALNPDYAEAHEDRGIAYARAGRADEALRDLDQALRLDPDYAAGYYNRALAFYTMKAYDKARADVEDVCAAGRAAGPWIPQGAGPGHRNRAMSPTMSHSTRTILAAAVIVVAVAAAYSKSFSGPFIFDDTTAIQRNATIRSLRSVEVLVPPG